MPTIAAAQPSESLTRRPGAPFGPRGRSFHHLSLWLLLILLCPLVATPVAAQGQGVVVEDLEEPGAEEAPRQAPSELDGAAVQQLFSEAEVTFAAQDPAAFSAFGRLVDLFENHLRLMAEAEKLRAQAEAPPEEVMPQEGTDPLTEDTAAAPQGDVDDDPSDAPPPAAPAQRFLDPESRQLFVRSLLYRAILGYDFGEDDLVQTSLGRILVINPDFDLDSEVAASAIPELPGPLEASFAKLQGQRLATVEVQAEPSDATLKVAGRTVTSGQPHRVLAGTVWIEVQRPGYSPYQNVVELRAGKTWQKEIVLERQSPVLRLRTRPSQAEVFLDGQPLGNTTGQASGEQINVGRYRPEEFSNELVVDGIATGVRRLEVRKEGFRPYRAELEVYELLDYAIPPIVLEGERGLLVFRDFPAGGKLVVNGAPRPLDNPSSSRPQVSLPPGDYQVTIESDRASMFSTRLQLADRQTVEVAVRLRPGLAFLGVVGEDANRRRDLDQALRQALARSGKWALLDRSAEAPPLLQSLGITVDALRAEADATAPGQHVDWAKLQWSADQRTPGLLYAMAVVNDTLLARQATVFIWPAAPGPPVANRWLLPSGAIEPMQRLETALNRPLELRRPWLGAILSDSPLSPHPLVFSVTSGGPAEAAGLRPGDLLIAISQVPVFSHRDVEQRLAAAEIGEVLDLGVQRQDGPHALRLTLRASPQVVDLKQEGLLPAVVFADLQVAKEGASPEIAWLIRLDQGRLLLASRQYEEAVRHLRDVNAPQTSHGFGQAAVDYWLGLALSNLDGSYRDAARQAFERATSLPEARLDHHDGPFVAPRAAARLLALGSF